MSSTIEQQIIALTIERTCESDHAKRNNLTRRIERLCAKKIISDTLDSDSAPKLAQKSAPKVRMSASERAARATGQRKSSTIAPKGSVDASWRSRKPSQRQMARIHRLERDLGYRLSTVTTIGTAGAASDLYHSLKAELRG